MVNKESVADEIFIVGSRYGELADEINPLYSREKPIDLKDIKKAIGDNEVYLKSVPNDHDEYAVAVFNQYMKRIGFVWMYQAPTIRYWMETNKQGYVKARITDVNPVANVLLAESVKPLDVPMIPRCCHNIDERWACNLPDVLRSISDQSLELGLFLLRDELSEATQWNKHLEIRIDNLLKSIPLDLSAYRHNDFMEVFNMMRKSPIKEVRDQSDWLLNTLVYRGSKEHVSWWAEKWLPSFFREAAEGDLLSLFESAHYTLEKVEEMLDCAPEHLFHLYKVNKPRFVNRLYYYALPQDIYNRLLTLLAVREAMLEKYGPEPEKDTKVPDPFVTFKQTRGIKETLLDYVERLMPVVSDSYKACYSDIWQDILSQEVVSSIIYKRGNQKGTVFNRNLVARIAHMLLMNGIIDKNTSDKRMTELLEPEKGRNHSVRGELALMPEDKRIKKAVMEVLDKHKR